MSWYGPLQDRILSKVGFRVKAVGVRLEPVDPDDGPDSQVHHREHVPQSVGAGLAHQGRPTAVAVGLESPDLIRR